MKRFESTNEDLDEEEHNLIKRTPQCCSGFNFRFGKCCCKWMNDDTTFPAGMTKKFSEGAEEGKIGVF